MSNLEFYLMAVLIVLFFAGNALVSIKRIRMERRVLEFLQKRPSLKGPAVSGKENDET
jgi:hypothetical protein